MWFAIALIARGVLFWIFLQEHGFHYSLYGWGVEGGDTPSYFTPIDSLINGNGYQPDLRMPGFLELRVIQTIGQRSELLVHGPIAPGPSTIKNNERKEEKEHVVYRTPHVPCVLQEETCGDQR